MKYIGATSFYLGGGGESFSDIEFTIETEVNNDLTLLFDVLIKRDTLGFNTQRVSVKKDLYWFIQ